MIKLKKIARYSFRILAWIVGILLVIWAGLWIYVGLNEAKMIAVVSGKIKEHTRGEVKINRLTVNLIRTFPNLSLQLSGIVIRDSMYSVHKKDFFTAGNIYLRLSIPGLITGKSPVGKVIISEGKINILTDTTGFSNEYMFKSDNSGKKEEKKGTVLPVVVLKNTLVTYQNPLRNKFHQVYISSMNCVVKDQGSQKRISIDALMVIRSLAFNTIKGSYLKDKTLRGEFELVFEEEKKDLSFDNIRIYLDRHPFFFKGVFHIDKLSPDFNLSIRAGKIDFAKLSSFLTPTIQEKIGTYSFSKPVDFEISLSGKTLYKYIPRVKAMLKVKDNKLTFSEKDVTQCNFTATLMNEIDPLKPRTDENTLISIDQFSGTWENIPIVSKLIKISNLKSPFLECDIASNVDLGELNSLTGSSTLQFIKGSSKIAVIFKGPVNGRDSMVSNLNGEIKIKDASIKYLPRNFLLTNCSGSLEFKNNDLFVNKLNATAGGTTLQMNGDAKNFLSLLNISPEKLVLHWRVFSDRLQLDDFKAFLSQAKSNNSGTSKAQFQNAASRIDKMFTDGDVYVNLVTPQMEYKKFTATDVRAELVLKPVEIALNDVSFNHAHGSMNIKGSMKDGKDSNPLILRTSMKNMDIPLLFTSFNNFGQDALTHENLKGRLSADIVYRTAITNKAELVNKASAGTIDFILENGELNNFEPLMKVSEKVFKKQDFSAIRFADIKNKLEVNGTTIIIDQMEIRSTAITLFVQGVYDVKTGTDMSIRLPLKNLTKSQANTDLTDDGKKKMGIAVRLRARTGDDGKLKVSWDPFGNSVRNKIAQEDSTVIKSLNADSTKLKK